MQCLFDQLQSYSRLNKTISINIDLLTRRSTVEGLACQNILYDRRLPSRAYTDLVRCLRRSYATVDMLRLAVRDTLRRHILQGPPITCPHPALYGRVVSRAKLAEDMCRIGHFTSKHHASIMINRALAMKPGVIARKWRRYHLAQYVQWSTFQMPPKDPFDGIRRRAYDLRAYLGLDRGSSRPPLIQLVYGLPKSIVPKFPTVAEAYSGDVWPYYFRLAPASLPHGVVAAWDARAEKAPRPETVHAPIRGEHLVGSMEEIRT